MLIRVICAHCRKPTKKERGHLQRARRQGMKIYCGLRCAGLARRKPKKRKKQRAEEKRLYDIEYRRRNLALIKRKKRLYNLRTYDPVKAAKVRKQNMRRHVEYCRRPEYKRWKSEYDKKYRALKFFGPFAEAYLLLGELNKHIAERITDYETRQENDTGNKAQKRRRADGAEAGRHRHKATDGE
jgi:hypothetical protein